MAVKRFHKINDDDDDDGVCPSEVNDLCFSVQPRADPYDLLCFIKLLRNCDVHLINVALLYVYVEAPPSFMYKRSSVKHKAPVLIKILLPRS